MENIVQRDGYTLLIGDNPFTQIFSRNFVFTFGPFPN